MHLYVDEHYTSPYALSVFVALHVKQLTFEMSTVDLARAANHAPRYAELSITQRVPTLVHDDFSLSESSAIVEYLDEVFPGTRLYPSAVRPRARARQVQAWLRSDLLPIRQERSTEHLFYSTPSSSLSSLAQAAAVKLYAGALVLLPQGHAHLFGEWSIVDVDLALMLQRLISQGDEVPARLANYAAQQWQHPAIQRWVTLSRPALS